MAISKKQRIALKEKAAKRWAKPSVPEDHEDQSAPISEAGDFSSDEEFEFSEFSDSFDLSETSDQDEETGGVRMADTMLGLDGGNKDTSFRFQRGPSVHRKTEWSRKRKAEDMAQEGRKHRALTNWFKPTSASPTVIEPISETVPRKTILKQAVDDMEKLLSSPLGKRLSGQDRKRHDGVLFYMNMQLSNDAHGGKNKRMALSKSASEGLRKGKWYAENLRKWEKTWIKNRQIPSGKQGMTTIKSWVSDEGLASFVREWMAEEGANATAYNLARAAREYVKSDKISDHLKNSMARVNPTDSDASEGQDPVTAVRVRTVRKWLARLGFQFSGVKKGVFKDGHEREDVVAYRRDFFLPKFLAFCEQSVQFAEDKSLIIPDGVEQPLMLITHDESSFNANDAKTQVWKYQGNEPLRKKGRGKSIMVSEFLTPAGRLCCSEEGKRVYATKTLETGSGSWWTGEMLLEQVKAALEIFKTAHPTLKGVRLFDNATSHCMFAPNALVATKVKLNPGGQQPRMKDGWYVDEKGERHAQKMVFEDDHPRHPGMPKGARAILMERGLWSSDLRHHCRTANRQCHDSGNCCAIALLSKQPDFKEQCSMIEEYLHSQGQLVLFFPKFHCECNWIEQFWGACKRFTREKCTYNISGLRENIPAAMSHVDDGPSIVRFFNKSKRIMEAYAKGITMDTEEFQNRVYRSHRRLEDPSKY